MPLYTRSQRRLYINAEERARFVVAARAAPLPVQALALTLLYTGCRLSEARELTRFSLDAEDQLLAVRSLKKRDQFHIREIPIPEALVAVLEALIASAPQRAYLWPGGTDGMIDRITAYRWIKQVMADAGIDGPQACPKGLRHGFGIHAIRSGIQLNMLQKWMGHSSIKTTAIYANAVGRDELDLARKMW